MSIVLASASPRRKELLEMLGVSDLKVIPAKGEEKAPEEAGPEEMVMALSAAKVKVTALSARSLPDGHAAINIVAEVKNKDELNFVINKLNNIQGVYYVARASGK